MVGLRTAPNASEASQAFACFGSTCTIIVHGRGPAGAPAEAIAAARARLLAWHDQFTRFTPDSELARLNADPRAVVPASAMMRRFVRAAHTAAVATGGLVDPTMAGAIHDAGYASDLGAPTVSLRDLLAAAGKRAPARPHPAERWRELAADDRGGTVRRRPGVGLDGGGIVKGLFADVLASVLGGHTRFVVDCGGDLRVGGTESVLRPVLIADPFGDDMVGELRLRHGAAATSGIGRRRWLRADGTPAHHLLDPSNGRPAFTGLVQVTALAPTAVRAEALAKAALLAGPGDLSWRLPYGGVAVHDDGTVTTVEAAVAP